MDLVRQDIKLVGVREEYAEDRLNWRQIIRCGEPLKGKGKRFQ